MPIRYDTLANRVRHHLMDERICSEREADAEINLMSNVELVETLSLVLEGMVADLEAGAVLEKDPPVLGPHGPGAGPQKGNSGRSSGRSSAGMGSERSALPISDAPGRPGVAPDL